MHSCACCTSTSRLAANRHSSCEISLKRLNRKYGPQNNPQEGKNVPASSLPPPVSNWQEFFPWTPSLSTVPKPAESRSSQMSRVPLPPRWNQMVHKYSDITVELTRSNQPRLQGIWETENLRSPWSITDISVQLRHVFLGTPLQTSSAIKWWNITGNAIDCARLPASQGIASQGPRKGAEHRLYSFWLSSHSGFPYSPSLWLVQKK